MVENTVIKNYTSKLTSNTFVEICTFLYFVQVSSKFVSSIHKSAIGQIKQSFLEIVMKKVHTIVQYYYCVEFSPTLIK